MGLSDLLLLTLKESITTANTCQRKLVFLQNVIPPPTNIVPEHASDLEV